MASITKRGTKWMVRWRDSFGVQYTRTCPTKKSADTLRLQVEVEQAHGRDWRPEVDNPCEVIDLEGVLTAFIEHRSLRLRGTTLRRYGENLDLFVRFLRVGQPDGTLTPALLSRARLESYYAWLVRPENGLHGSAREADTARKIVEVAQLAWKWADGSERWPGEIPSPRSIEMVRTAPKAVVAPTFVEMAACVQACTGWQRKLATFLYYTGLRVGETMLLEWRDLDVAAARLTIRPEISKTNKGRIIPLSPLLIEEVSAWGIRTGYILPSGRQGGSRERQARARDMKRAWVRAGVREAAFDHDPHHAFRKGFKSGMLALGVAPDAVDFLQGHELGEGARGRYIDPWLAFPLVEAVTRVPKVGSSNVVSIAARIAAKSDYG